MKGLYDEAQKLDPGDAHDDDLRPAARAPGPVTTRAGIRTAGDCRVGPGPYAAPSPRGAVA